MLRTEEVMFSLRIREKKPSAESFFGLKNMKCIWEQAGGNPCTVGNR
jgi:hypothetical protein